VEVTLTLSAQAKSLEIHERIPAFAGLMVCIALLSFMVYIFYAYAPSAAKKFPAPVVNGGMRIIAFLLMCIGAQITWRGLHALLLTARPLVQRIYASKTITLHTCSEVVLLEGETRLSHVTWRSDGAEGDTRFATEHLLIMIGADTCTKWLRECVDLDPGGFVRTSSGSEDRGVFETSVQGIFAVGDVRSGSVKRVASAVGEGSVVVAAIHKHLGNL
jgi:thioredoxin reductase